MGFKNKVRWVVCGNYESKKEGEENYSGGADAAAFRCLVHQAAQYQWHGASIDIKTAFLNAEVKDTGVDNVVLVKPPAFFCREELDVQRSSLPTFESGLWFSQLTSTMELASG